MDPSDTASIAREIKKILTDVELWNTYSKNGIINVRKHYTWEAHVDDYLAHLRKLHSGVKENVFSMSVVSRGVGKRLAKLNNFIITDIDNTLIGEDNSSLEELISIIRENRDILGFGIATGRSADSAMSYLKEYDVPEPDVLIASVGSEIFYNGAAMYDYGWDTHISHKWDRNKIVQILMGLLFLNTRMRRFRRNTR